MLDHMGVYWTQWTLVTQTHFANGSLICLQIEPNISVHATLNIGASGGLLQRTQGYLARKLHQTPLMAM